MARIRTIKPELFEDEALGTCSRDARLLFVGLISHADDEGRQRGAPRLILANCFPYDEDITHGEVRSWLEELVRAGVILLYEHAQQLFVQLAGWAKHQRVDHGRPSALPPPETPIATGAPEALASDSRAIPEPLGVEGNGRDKDKEETSSLVELVFEEWQRACEHPKAKLDSRRRRAINARVREGRTLEDFQVAIRGAARAPFVNEQGAKFDDIELVCRNASKFEAFADRAAPAPAKGWRALGDAAIAEQVERSREGAA